jgi:hypothetical protein
METTPIPPDAIFLTIDVTNLYPSITHTAGLAALRRALNWAGCPSAKAAFILDLMHWVLTNNYFSFGDLCFHQLQGTAMGTPAAVDYANIFLAVLEYDVFQLCSHHPHFRLPFVFKRFIDDIFSIFPDTFSATLFRDTFAKHDPSITITHTLSHQTAIHMDLEFYKGSRFHATGLVDVRLFQKEQNRYLYLPPFSFHAPSVFRGFISSEIKRYRLACSNDEEFSHLLHLFYQRLQARAYPHTFLAPLFSNPPSRPDLIRHSHNLNNRQTTRHIPPLLIKVPYCNRTANLPISRCLQPADTYFTDPDFRQIIGNARVRPIICYTSPPNLGNFLTSSHHPYPIIPSRLYNSPTHQVSSPSQP